MMQYTEKQITALNEAADTFMSRYKDIDFYSERLVKATVRPMNAFERVDKALTSLSIEAQKKKDARSSGYFNDEWNRMRTLALEATK